MEAQEEEDMGSVNGSPTATFVKLLGKDAQLVNAGEHWVTRVCIPWEDKALCWLFNASGSHQGHIQPTTNSALSPAEPGMGSKNPVAPESFLQCHLSQYSPWPKWDGVKGKQMLMS